MMQSEVFITLLYYTKLDVSDTISILLFTIHQSVTDQAKPMPSQALQYFTIFDFSDNIDGFLVLLIVSDHNLDNKETMNFIRQNVAIRPS